MVPPGPVPQGRAPRELLRCPCAGRRRGRRCPAAAEMAEPVGDWAWRRWGFEWSPEAAGSYELLCRARDAAGNEQPAEPEWNLGGYGNNAVQRVSLTVVQAG